MKMGIQILCVEPDSTDGLIVKFSDDTVTGYVVEELLELRPIREKIREIKPSPRLKPQKIK
jgi:hypothetical protein